MFEWEENEFDHSVEDDEDSERLSVYDAALIWASNGKDEDYPQFPVKSTATDRL